MTRIALGLAPLCLLLCLYSGGCGVGRNILATPPRGEVQTPTRPQPTITKRTPSKPCFKLGKPIGPPQQELFQLINDYRARNGLNRLRYSRTLELAANRFAEKMYREKFFGHTAPDGSEPGDRAVAAGYCDPIVGENIAYGMNRMGQATETMQGFIDSPHHNENMLLKRWRYAGIGFFRVQSHKGTEYWWVQLFGMDVPENAILPSKVKKERATPLKRKARRKGAYRNRSRTTGRDRSPTR